MRRICLDTSGYGYFMKGNVHAVEIIASALWIGLPSIVLGELRTGFLMGNQSVRNEEELRKFLRHPMVEILEVDDEAARIYAEIIAALRSAGTPLPTNDVWIAAVAAREGATILTYDDHFRLIHRVGSTVLSA
ncbi:MAG: type II toxin-antitoxin system VapC family toxin [Acidobacteria bacterium]|nr:type II toxin-antitoxin system VapC family toxin [Acidobacteriota bacterium]